MKTPLLALLLATSAGVALAQQAPYATIKSVEGLVTVTSGNQLSNATANMNLSQGAQVLSTASGKATVVFGSGCTVTVNPGQTLLIEETACTAFLAANPPAAAGAGISTTQVLVGAAGLGVLYEATRGRGRGAVVVLPPEPGPPSVTPPAVIPPVVPAPPLSGV
jgi:hypothetical protein